MVWLFKKKKIEKVIGAFNTDTGNNFLQMKFSVLFTFFTNFKGVARSFL